MSKGKLRVERPFLLIGIVLVALVLLAAPLPAFSQSCALCYTQAASAGARMIQALRSGILILVVPPTFMSVAMISLFITNAIKSGAPMTSLTLTISGNSTRRGGACPVSQSAIAQGQLPGAA